MPFHSSPAKSSSCGPLRQPGSLRRPPQHGIWGWEGILPTSLLKGRPALAFIPANSSLWSRIQTRPQLCPSFFPSVICAFKASLPYSYLRLDPWSPHLSFRYNNTYYKVQWWGFNKTVFVNVISANSYPKYFRMVSSISVTAIIYLL